VRRNGLVCIENGANTVKYADAAAPEPTKGIAYIGRFSANKRLDRLIGFHAALRRIDEQWRLIIAGRPWDLDVAQITELTKRGGWRTQCASWPTLPMPRYGIFSL